MPTGATGTYPLSEVMIDRFAYSYSLGYLTKDEELELISNIDVYEEPDVEQQSTPEEIVRLRDEVRKVYVSDSVREYIVSLVNYIRGQEEVLIGPSPRASIWLYKGSRALAFMDGMDFVIPDHIKYLAPFVLGHRIRIKPEYEAEGVRPIDLVSRALKEVEVPKI